MRKNALKNQKNMQKTGTGISHDSCNTKELDMQTAQAKLETMGLSIDKWTDEQEAYARAYAEGT